MKRRMFGLFATGSLVAVKLGIARAEAQTSADPALLTTTLTPFGAERAGNADGSIPAWTGGNTTIPAGWTDGAYMPDQFADEEPILTIDASNMAQHADRLTDGMMALMTKYGHSIKVYPTHRTAAAPQWIYDNIAANVGRAKLNPAGGRLGFIDGYGGAPFPIPDTSNPLDAGAQIMWNQSTHWLGSAYYVTPYNCAMIDGQFTICDVAPAKYQVPYYKKTGSLATYSGIEFRQINTFIAPANIVGEQVDVWNMSDPYDHPNISWELLNGQGRVRKAPEISFDTPSSFVEGIAGYDEYFGFYGSLEKYDWKYLTKKELYIPYNNNGMFAHTAQSAFLDHFLDPNIIRWELHRVWVVEATLHPGERNVLARRRFYVDEDTWNIGVSDAWDGSGNLYKVNTCYNNHRPDLPGTIYMANVVTNLQTGDYCTPSAIWNQKAHPTLRFVDDIPDSEFDPQVMAASGQY